MITSFSMNHSDDQWLNETFGSNEPEHVLSLIEKIFSKPEAKEKDFWSTHEISFQKGDFIMFGRESSGVPEEVHNRHAGLRVPMIKSSTRSLNLSNTVAIVAYEALRQIGFPNMK